jgi:hypothetical protein
MSDWIQIRAVTDPYIALPIALILLIFAGTIWYVLVRPVPEKSGIGVITNRIFQAAEEVVESVPRTTRSLDQYPKETRYTLPDRYNLEIRLENENAIVHFWVPALPSQNIEIGQNVNVVYLERGIPFVWGKIFVKKIAPLMKQGLKK